MQNGSMTATQLRSANYMMLVVVSVASPFLLWDFYVSIAKDVPRLGVFGYVTGPMFAHKLSEILIAGAWLWFAFMHNHEKANMWPAWMPLSLAAPDDRRGALCDGISHLCMDNSEFVYQCADDQSCRPPRHWRGGVRLAILPGRSHSCRRGICRACHEEDRTLPARA